MSTNKRQPLIFSSIKVGSYGQPGLPPAPDQETVSVEPAPAEPTGEAAAEQSWLNQPTPSPAPEPLAEVAPEARTESAPEAELETPPQPEPLPRSEPMRAEGPPAAPAGALTPASETHQSVVDRPFAPIPTQRTAAERQTADNRGLYIAAAVGSALWVAGLAALVWRQQQLGAFQFDGITVAVLAALAAAPVGFAFAMAYAAGQGRRLAAESRRTQRLADQLLAPVAVAAAEAGSLVATMRGEIEDAAEAANQAREHLLALREALAMETERLMEASDTSLRSARGLTEVLGRERTEMTQLAVTLDARSAAVADAIARQAQMVKDAADLAEAQLREGQVTLAGGAADIAAAAGEAADAARTASGELNRQVGRLETAATAVGDQMRVAEEGLTQQRAALVTVAHAMRSDQEDFAALAETRTAQLAEFLSRAKLDVGALGEVAALGAQSVSELINKAADQFRELADAAERERETFSSTTEASLGALVAAGQREREALAEQMQATTDALSAAATEAREAADVHAEAARARVDQLNEAAFAAGQKADEIFELRLNEAKRLIETSASIVEQAGAETAQRLEAGAAEARGALAELQAMVQQLTERADALPAEADSRTAQIKAAMEQGMEELLASARRAAEETQAIDRAFQERVRRNYEMLAEAVQLMGIVAGNAGAAAPALSRPGPLPRVQRVEAPGPAPEPEAPADSGVAAPPALAAPEAAEPNADDAGLRPRLKLTPTATDQEFKAVFDSAAGRPAELPTPGEDGWTWKELLGGLDESDEGDAEAGGADHLNAEIISMGIDPSALLPKQRIDEIAATVQTGDANGTRQVVQALAPAAIRRLSRRMLADGGFKSRAGAFLGQFEGVVRDASRRDHQGYEVIAVLNSEAGRAYLLLDAAAGPR